MEDRLDGYMAEWLDLRLTGLLSRWPTKWIRDRLICYQVGYMTGWLTNWLDVGQTGWLANWKASIITVWPSEHLVACWLIGWMLD